MKTIRIYTTSYCPYCTAAKSLLRAENLSFEEIDASDVKTRHMLVTLTGRRTVPQIFFGDESIGGFDELNRLKQSGALYSALSKIS